MKSLTDGRWRVGAYVGVRRRGEGRAGYTHVRLGAVNRVTLRRAIEAAWKNLGPKRPKRKAERVRKKR